MHFQVNKKTDREISEEAKAAIAAYTGPVTQCPPCTFAIDYAAEEIERRKRGDNGWMSQKESGKRVRDRQAKFERAAAARENPKPESNRVYLTDGELLGYLTDDWQTTVEVAQATGASLTPVRRRLSRMADEGRIEHKPDERMVGRLWRRLQV